MQNKNKNNNKNNINIKKTLLARLISLITNFFSRKKSYKHNTYYNNKDIIDLLCGKKSIGKLKDNPEFYILNNIVKMREKTAEDILVPRVDIVAAEKDITLDELLKIFTKYGYSRLPVYNDSLDDTLGFVHVKDLINILKKGSDLNIENLLRPVLFVSPYIKVLDMLFEMIAKRHHIAMVVDEFGGIDGLITIEDIIEEIVGDINDEYDRQLKSMIFLNKPGYMEVDARLSVGDLEEKIGPFLDEEEINEVDTVGGLIAFLSGRVVGKNEIIKHPSGIEFEILAADPLKITKIGVHYKGYNQNKDKKDDSSI